MSGTTNTPDDGRIRRAVENLKGRAEEYLHNQEKMRSLIESAREKVKNQTDDKGPLTDVWVYLTALVRLLRAYARKEYRDIPWQSIVLATVAVLYFVNPLDLIPDAIPFAGYVDDAAVLAFVVRQIKVDLDGFMRWESERRPGEESESTA